jgi:hypothetical protein
MTDRLYLIAAPFEDLGGTWYCNDCATMEGALLANPDWLEAIEVRRLAFPRPRDELIELLGEAHQSMPVLVMPAQRAPAHAVMTRGWAILTDPKDIARELCARHGGAGPHP